MSIKSRGNSFVVDIRKKGFERVRRSFPTKEQATLFEAQVAVSHRTGTPLPDQYVPESSYTLAKAQDACFKMHWEGGKSEEANLNLMKVHCRYFGANTPISAINTGVLDGYIEHMKLKRRANGTINRHLACISKVLKLAHEQDKLSKLPHFHRQKEGQGRIRWLTDEEEAKILQTLRLWGSNKFADACVVLLDTGMRKSELLRVTKSDITKQGVYCSDRKGNSQTIIPLTSRARKILEIYARTSNDICIMSGYYNKTVWSRMQTHLNLPDVSLHVLRHTCCSRLVQGGMPLVHVKGWMGHKSITTTMRYAHLAPTDLIQGVTLLENRA